jgi:hypothetical protein
MAVCNADCLSALRVQGAHSAVELCWGPDEPGDEPDCGRPETNPVLSTRLVLAPNTTLGVALDLGLYEVGIEVGFGNKWGADAAAHGRPRLGVVVTGSIDKGDVPVVEYSGCERIETE